ncbi:protein IDA-LIKE 1 isoform X2 [Capsella rubella]|uniref:protein IDA-LIKE 1 isoform X2 n=1 Tax=Capsella rubella TaxID=81985 RepID=UPI000CD56935|nr:protein IDA-LIKE 1 isoform X2 [Capsella rubella]
MSPPSLSFFSEHYFSHRTMFVTLYIVLLLVFGSYNATARVGPVKVSESDIVQTRSSRQEITVGFRFKGRVFHLLSKKDDDEQSGICELLSMMLKSVFHGTIELWNRI